MKTLILLLLFATLSACSSRETRRDYGELIHTEKLSFYIDTLATGLQHPWGMEFLPDGRILIAERPGRLRVWQNGQLMQQPVSGLPAIWSFGQGGLLDVVMHPDYENNRLIYLVYAALGAEGAGSTAISRGRLIDQELVDVETLFHAVPHTGSAHHFGSRIVFDDEGYLFSTIGDRGEMNTAQDLSSHNGTVIRLYDDGRIPSDNPFAGREDALPEIWSYGHRNIQGMKVHPVSRDLWVHEHGPRGGDEINLIHKGGNYGWPLVTHGINYDGTIITPDTTAPGMIDPILHWTPSIAPCGMTFVTSDRFPQWHNNMLVGALAGQHIHRVVFEDTTVIHTEKMLKEMARFRAIEQGPDGLIYVLTEGPGLFFRLIPE
ncbi:MAG: PQQ-dependent sugar dehydrogenase [Bacteroidales bacterium]|nr:PQQ-dependent sugar dehydrogenase [Bacteroidales bacterium]